MLQAPAIQLPKENISVFTQRARRKHYLFFMCVSNVFNFTNVKLHLLQRNCSWLPQYSCNIKCFVSCRWRPWYSCLKQKNQRILSKPSFCETQPPASIGWEAESSVVRSFFRPASVTSPLISTIWCFRAYKPYIFCEDMILATCQCQHIFCCWVEPSLLLSSFLC